MRTLISLFLLISVVFLIASCGKESADNQTGQVPADTTMTGDQAAKAPAEMEKAADQAGQVPAKTEKPADRTAKTPAKTEKTSNQAAQTSAKPKKEVTYVTVPESTAVAIVLVDSIDTDLHPSGTEFKGSLSGPIVVDGRTLFAEGAQVKGVLNRVVESGRLKTPAELDFSLTAIQDKSGSWTSIDTYMIQEKKGSHTNREVAMIGGGAVVGGVIGKIIDKKGSTTVGTAAGAAVGTAAAALTGKQDIVHPTGTQVTFFLKQPAKIALE